VDLGHALLAGGWAGPRREELKVTSASGPLISLCNTLRSCASTLDTVGLRSASCFACASAWKRVCQHILLSQAHRQYVHGAWTRTTTMLMLRAARRRRGMVPSSLFHNHEPRGSADALPRKNVDQLTDALNTTEPPTTMSTSQKLLQTLVQRK